MTTKELFLSKKPLVHWWTRTIDDPNFAEVLLHARSAYIEAGATREELTGARLYEAILLTLAEGEPSPIETPSPGLHHNIEVEPPMPKALEIPPKPQPKQIRKRK